MVRMGPLVYSFAEGRRVDVERLASTPLIGLGTAILMPTRLRKRRSLRFRLNRRDPSGRSAGAPIRASSLSG